MDVGTLVGYIDLDDSKFGTALSGAGREFQSFSGRAERDMQKLESSIQQGFGDAGRDAERGGKQIAQGLDHGLGQGLDKAMGTARKSGHEAGQEFGGGIEAGGGAKMPGIGKALGAGMLTSGFAAVGLAAGALFMDGFSKAMDAEKANDKLAAQLGLSAEKSKQFGQIAGEVYANAYGESASQVNDAIKAIWQNGLIDEKSVSGEIAVITEDALTFADAMDVDVSEAARAAGKMIKTGLADNATEAFDILTKGFQGGANEAGDLLDSFSEYSTMFRDIGLDGQTAMGLLSQGLQAGARDADTVGDALKEFAIRAQDGSDTSAKGFEAIGLSAKKMTDVFAKGGPDAAAALDTVLDRLRDMKDPAERNAAAVALFGTKAEDLGDALFALDPSNAVQALGDTTGAVMNLGDTMRDNAETRIEQFKRSLESGVVNFIGDKVLPALDSLSKGFQLSGITDAIHSVVGTIRGWVDQIVADVKRWYDQNKATVDGIIAKAKELGQKFGDTVREVGGLIKDLWSDKSVGPMLDQLATTVEAMLKVLDGFLDRFRGIVKIIHGVVTGNWSEVWSGMKLEVEGNGKILEGAVDLLGSNIVRAFGGNWKQVKADAKSMWDGIVQWFRDAGQWVSNALSWLGDLPNKISTWFGLAKDWAIQKFTELITWFTGLPTKIGEALAGLGEQLKQWFGLAWEGVKWALTEGLQWLIAWIIVLPYKAVEAGQELGAKLAEWMGQAWEWVKTTAATKGQEFLDWATALPGRIVEAVSNFGAQIGEWAANAWQWAKDTAAQKGQELLDWARGLPGRVVDGVRDLGGRLLEWARGAWQSAKEGTTSKAGELIEWVRGLPDRIVSAIGDIGGKLVQAGKEIINGLLRGIQDAMDGVLRYVSGIADKIRRLKGPLPYDRKLLIPAGQAIMGGLLGGLKSQESAVFGYVSALGGKLATAGTMTATLGVNGAPVGSQAGSDRQPVHIENFHATPQQSPHDIAVDLDWMSRAGGR